MIDPMPATSLIPDSKLSWLPAQYIDAESAVRLRRDVFSEATGYRAPHFAIH
jgi:hypothetical protein